ncbi:putative transcriptional regulator [Bradyrhizobium sp. USDA 4524]|uniref:hypothetical protein n=1 Tax=unclassified Bradyrhizobium TaxID=2631580 RepID=UPI00209FE407|nr:MULTISPECIES: hypothetical protein [unclassified Bradyrhizobium]MCP1838992.1 putative transcriptional regulator [Bradyrhizobium sp. USDA 4538]MCP1899559.1 putative transcriptional regulator [Bradyrhizobium sp. USDA 4537]MCP1986332.1 putative transcriptional regulator [Bradyrhizobium sp. USDA 4539]
MVQAEKDIVEQMLSSLTISLLQNRVAPSYEQVMHHFGLACEKAGLIATEEVAIRILKRVSREINEAHSVLEFVGRGADLLH